MEAEGEHLITHSLPAHRWFALGLIGLALGLIGNTLLGPLVSGSISYPFSETVLNETLGLEAVSLALVAPLALLAGALAWRGHHAAGLVAMAPASYAAYMFVQYVVGPQYPTYQPSIALHLALLVLSGGLLLRAWRVAEGARLRPASRRAAVVAFLLGGFVLSRWLVVFGGMVDGSSVPAAPQDLTMYWSIFLLDLGAVVPAAVVTGLGLLTGATWARKAVYGVVGWFALVPPSVAAMALVKIARDDPMASVGDTAVFVVVTLLFWLVAAWLFRPLFGSSSAGPINEPAAPGTGVPVTG
jgi:hypothetical protein